MKRFSQHIDEDAPANAAGNGGVAGIGIGPKGEPGVDLKKRKKEIEDMAKDAQLDEDRDTFAGAPVFTVDLDRVMATKHPKNRYHKYSRYVGTDEIGETIRQHGRKHRGDIVIKDHATQVMTYLRRKHNV
jgi:hypothetical protein